MIAKNLISSDIPTVKSTDTGSEVLALIGLYHVQHLPVVENKRYLGLISEEDIYQEDDGISIGNYDIQANKSYVKEDDHLFEMMSLMAKQRLTLIPVLDNNGNYLGSITQDRILQFYASSFTFEEPGSLLVLETAKNNYSLVEISSIVEQEHAVILGTLLSGEPESTQVQVTLKINKTNIQHIIASFERYGYTILGSFYEDDYIDNLKSRYDALMNYLSI